MNQHPIFGEEEIHAFIDHELPPQRAQEIATAMREDAQLAARIAAFTADKEALAAVYRGIAAQPVPSAWIKRIERAAVGRETTGRARPQWRVAPWAMAIAATLLLVFGAVSLRHAHIGGADTILIDAQAARDERTHALTRLTGLDLDNAVARDQFLARTVGLKLHTPDLEHLGWKLAEIDSYAGAAALRYRAEDGRSLTLFVRPSHGEPRFDLLKNGNVRTCIWQDEVVSAVMMGEMSAGQMMRVASAAYTALNL